jgi:hypothetical protein
MLNLSLTACSFNLRVINSRGTNHIYNLNDEIELINEDEGQVIKLSVIDMFKAFFDHYANTVNDENKLKTFNCEFKDEYCGETENYKYIYVLIKSGIYGSSSEIKNIETQEITYIKQANESEERPFYLFIVIPKDVPNVKVQKGMFIFQNVGPFGVKTITTDYIKQFFATNYSITLTCKSVAPKLFIDRVLKKDNINQLIMTKNHISSDSSDNIGRGYGVETRVISSLRFGEDIWQRIFSKITNFIAGRHNLFEFEEKEYNELKVTAIIGDKSRVINLHNIENLSIIESIPNTIKGLDGHPKKDELINYLRDVAEEYLREMVLNIS